MTNIEPTEEQREAAARFYYRETSDTGRLVGYVGDWVKTGDGVDDVDSDVVDFARLLSEREAKLEEHIKWLETQCVSFEDANINNQKTIKALNEENQRYCEQVAIEKRHWSNLNKHNEKIEAEADTLRARVAELERTEAKLTAACQVANATNKRRAERETQHLADIRAGRKAVAAWIDDPWLEGRHKLGVDFLASTAHYDDAKAAEGGEG